MKPCAFLSMRGEPIGGASRARGAPELPSTLRSPGSLGVRRRSGLRLADQGVHGFLERPSSQADVPDRPLRVEDVDRREALDAPGGAQRAARRSVPGAAPGHAVLGGLLPVILLVLV